MSHGPSIWWALAGIVLVGVVWESSAPAGGLLLLVLVFGMLLTAEKSGTIAFGSGASGSF